MRTLVYILSFFFAMASLKAQSYFNKVYDYDGTDTYSNHSTSVIELPSSNYLVAGNSFGPPFSGLHYFLIDSGGDTLWNKRYSKANCGYYSAVENSLIPCYDGNLAHCGSFIDSSGNSSALLVKLTENGDTLWTKRFGGPGFDAANSIAQTPDSGFVLMGIKENPVNPPSSDFYLVKTDKNGNAEWEQTYGSNANDEDCISGDRTLDGGFVMAGRIGPVLYVVKVDAAGGFEWQQSYPGTKNIAFITQLADSTYLLAGAKDVSGLAEQACLMKLTKTGAVTWQKTYGGSTLDLFYTRPVVLEDGSIVTAGTTLLGSKPIGLLVKTDSSGNQLWLRNYYADPTKDNYVYDLKRTSDNGFIMTGSGHGVSQDAWVVKVDSLGCEVMDCSVGMGEFKEESSRFRVFPNPASDKINLLMENDNMSDYTIIVTNILGELQITELNAGAISISHLSPGIYFISAENKRGQRFTEKFVKGL